MGSHPNIAFAKFPKQGNLLGVRAEVCFNYDTTKIIRGLIVRDDIEAPFLTIIQLSDGRYVEGNECQYKPVTNSKRER